MSDRPPIELEPGTFVPASRVLETMAPRHQSEALCDVIKRGDEELVHWAMVMASECKPYVHADVLQEAAGSDSPVLALEAVRSQAALESEQSRFGILGRALGSDYEAVALEAAERLRGFDIRRDPHLQIDMSDTLKFGIYLTKHEAVGLQILDLATGPGLHGTWKEFRVVCKAQLHGPGSARRIARARVVEMQKTDPNLNEFRYRH